MMERNGILLAGKKIIKGLLVSSIVLASAQADFLMTLTDKNGVEENLCVKSYSFSNNMESLHKEVKQMKDVYSEEETLTNKVFMDKPVYRKIVKPSNSHAVHYIYVAENIDNVVNIDARIKYNYNGGLGYYSQEVMRGDHSSVIHDLTKPNEIQVYLKKSDIDPINTYYIVEYTKTTDTAQTNTNELTTLVHYLPSDSTNGGYITKSTKNLKIGFFENYRYDASTNSCIAPTN